MMEIIWHYFPENKCDIAANIDTCRVYYYPKQKTLILEEMGKVYDDHAYAKFTNITREQSEYILRKLEVLKTV